MICSLVPLVLVVPLCKLDLTLSFVHSNNLDRSNRLFLGPENAELPRSASTIDSGKKKSLGQHNVLNNRVDSGKKMTPSDKFDLPKAKGTTGESTTANLSEHIKIVESFVNKITHAWKYPGLKEETHKVLNLFNLELTDEGPSADHGSKIRLESQLDGLMDYNNLERKLEMLIIKNYDKVQQELGELDTLFHKLDKVDIFADAYNKSASQCKDNQSTDQCTENPSIFNLIVNRLMHKSRQLNKSLNKFCNKYLFSSRIIKFLIKIFFPVFNNTLKVKQFNVNDILHFYDVPLSENFEGGNIQIYRNGLPSGKKDAWRLTFLGTGSRRVTTTRGASSIAFEPKGRNGPIWLFDCGEGTRLNLLKQGFSPTKVEKIFLTHLHGDHSLGVFSFISDISKWGKVEIYGPDGIGNMINSVHSAISRCFTHKCVIKELNDVAYDPPTHETFKISTHTNTSSVNGGIKANKDLRYNVVESHNIKLTAVPIRHNLPTVGYVLEELEVLKGKRPRIICLLQDTCDATMLYKFIKCPDVVIHESTYSTVTLSGTKRFISQRDLGLLDEIVVDESARSCYDAASALAMDLAISKRAGALKRIPNDLIRQLAEMKEKQAMVSHRTISKDRNSILKYHLTLLYNLKKRLALFENLVMASNNISDSMVNLKYFLTFQEERNNICSPFSSPELVKFWQEAIKPQLNQCKLTSASINAGTGCDNLLQGIIEDIVWIYGHSTEAMAGRLAGMLRAKSLVLTHFSSRLPGDNNLESILTMKRIESNARREMEFAGENLSLDANGNVTTLPNVNNDTVTNSDNRISAGVKNKKKYCPRVIAAWDGFYIDVPPH